MKYIYICLFVMVFLEINAQSLDNQKYLLAVLHLKSDSALQQRVKSFFKKVWKKKEVIDFNVSPNIAFIAPILIGYTDINDSYLDSLKDLSNIQTYRETYRFPAYTNSFLKKVFPEDSHTMTLVFSKPIENHLVAEMQHRVIAQSNEGASTKIGYTFQFIFTFDSEGVIEDVISKPAVYN